MKYDKYSEIKPVLQNIMQDMLFSKQFIDECLNCNRLLYINLSEVNVIPDNRTGSKSKQTHIHISGKNMNMFYSAKELEESKKNKKSTDDEKVDVYLISKNIEYLNSEKEGKEFNKSNKECRFIKSYTYKKISIRADGSQQVQISKLRLDGKEFLNFRQLLFVHYGLFFLERKDGQGYNILGIDRELVEKYNISLPSLLLDNDESYLEVKEDETEYEVSGLNDEELEEVNTKLNNIDITSFKGNNKQQEKSGVTQRVKNLSSKGRKTDYINIQKIKKEIGEFGEKLILSLEKTRLIKKGYKSLAQDIEWTSIEKGDGLGFDIKSFDVDENGKIINKYIEVKTTLNQDKPFEISLNEIEKAEELNKNGKYIIARVYNINFENKTYNYYFTEGVIEQSYVLKPILFRASKLK